MAKFQKKAGFTLVELLVVISIIALLLSILMPSMGKARKQARKIVCQSNIRQVGQAVELYKIDFNGHYPAPRFKWEYRWWHHLIPYIGLGSYDMNNSQDKSRWTQNDPAKIPDIIKCPGSPKESPYVQQMNSWVMGNGDIGFAKKSWIGPPPTTTFEYKRYYWRETRLRKPSYYVMLYEGDWYVDSGTFHYWRTAHTGGSNVLTASCAVEYWPVNISNAQSNLNSLSFSQAWTWWSRNHYSYFLRFLGPGFYE